MLSSARFLFSSAAPAAAACRQLSVDEVKEAVYYEELKKQIDQSFKEISAESARAHTAYKIIRFALCTREATAFWQKQASLASPAVAKIHRINGSMMIARGVRNLRRAVFAFENAPEDGCVVDFSALDGSVMKGRCLEQFNKTFDEAKLTPLLENDTEANLLLYLATFASFENTFRTPKTDNLLSFCLFFCCGSQGPTVAGEFYTAIINTVTRKNGKNESNLDSLQAFIKKYPDLAAPAPDVSYQVAVAASSRLA